MEKLCVKCQDFGWRFVNGLDSLWSSEDLVDVTIICEGKTLKAHKVILSACSPYFRNVFKENPCPHPIMILKGVLGSDMARLLAYLYRGEVLVSQAELPGFLQTARLLEVQGLTEQILQEDQTIPQSSTKKKRRINVAETAEEITNNNDSYLRDIPAAPSIRTVVKEAIKCCNQFKKQKSSPGIPSTSDIQSDPMANINIVKVETLMHGIDIEFPRPLNSGIIGPSGDGTQVHSILPEVPILEKETYRLNDATASNGLVNVELKKEINDGEEEILASQSDFVPVKLFIDNIDNPSPSAYDTGDPSTIFSDVNLPCPVCAIKFTNKLDLLSHIRLMHSFKKIYKQNCNLQTFYF